LCLSSWRLSSLKARSLTFLLAGVLSFLIAAAGAHAQTAQAQAPAPTAAAVPTLNTSLRLNDRQVEYDAVPYLYSTRDAGDDLSAREIYQRHRNNLRGDRLEAGPVNFSFDSVPHWLVMDITNDSHKSDWVFDFGSLSDGRAGLARQIFIMDGIRGTTLVDTDAHVLPNGHSMFLRLMPDQQVTLVMLVAPTDHAPFIIAPRILEAAAVLRGDYDGGETLLRNCVLILMAGAAIYFAGGMLLRRGIGFFPHALFFAAQALWFWVSSGQVFADAPGSAHLPGVMLAAGGLFALAITQSIFAAQDNETGDSLVLYICASFVVLTIMMFMFVMPLGSPLRLPVIAGAAVLAYAVAAFKAFTVGKDMLWAGRLAGIAWLLLLGANALPYLSANGTLPISPLFLQAPAIVMPLVCVLLILSGTWYIRASNVSLAREVLRQANRAQAASKRRASKETADQARLLRVIEREREIMEDLRAREAERTEEMRMAKITADEANRAKSAFLAVVSHEIRTPMTGIMGMVRLLMDTQLTREQRDYAQTIQDSGDAMLALLNDILDFSKISSGGLDLEVIDFDLHRVVGSVAMLMNGHATQRGITLESDIDVDAPRFLKGDPTRIRQVLLNLVGNAIKFTQRGGVTLSLRAGDPALIPASKPNLLPVTISVKDTGIGISEEAQKNLFNPFSQADSSIARKFGGTGLGLAICKRLIEAMGSDIELTSVEGQGTTFTFTLLLPPGDQKAAASEGRAGAEFGAVSSLAKPMDILVVDDNAVNRKVMEGLLARDGHRVTSVTGGREALDILAQRSFQLVFMDIEMPEMNGLEAMKLIREHMDARVAATPVVALTGNVGEEDRARYKEAGMKDIVAKPIDPERLRNILLAHGQAAKPRNPSPAKSNEKPVMFDLTDAELDEDSFADSVEYTSTPRLPAPETPAPQPEAATPVTAENEIPARAAPDAPAAEPERVPSLAPMPSALDETLINVAAVNALKASLGEGQLKEMLEGVFAHNKTVLPVLQTAFNDGDVETLRGCAHELKGMNGNFGLAALARMTETIERACREGKLQSAALDEIIFHDLPEAMDATEQAFKGA
jgi:signal transduction histidine kinase/FixJ family two-component response regulator/HPt (histidine-containing phosphotransfer) domain-containing protein